MVCSFASLLYKKVAVVSGAARLLVSPLITKKMSDDSGAARLLVTYIKTVVEERLDAWYVPLLHKKK